MSSTRMVAVTATEEMVAWGRVSSTAFIAELSTGPRSTSSIQTDPLPIHELGHLVTGRALGVPVDHITWCTPANGRIAFSYQEPAFVSYAGGFTAALALAAVYRFLIWPRLAGRSWRAAGVAVLGTAVAQVIVGVMEGSSPQRYARAQSSVWGLVLLVVLPLVGAAIIQRRMGLHAKPGE